MFVVRNRGDGEPEGRQGPEDAETIDAAGGSECREHDLQSRGHELETRNLHSINHDRSVVAVDRAREDVSVCV